ncbi:MAG TPA: addiction module protein [Pirellulaceae bacterium]|nr:addiction module protein [Pirellulaceae bacterium]
MNLPISSMTIAERIAAMEELWASLQRDADEIAPPDWHGRVLAERQKRIANGQISFSSLEEVRARLENREE